MRWINHVAHTARMGKKPEGKRPRGWPRSNKEDNIKMVLTKFEDVCSIRLTQNWQSGGLL